MNEIKLRMQGPLTEVSPTFLQYMVNRMSASYYKYGPINDNYPDKISALASLEQRLMKYKETGNTEWLVDAANFAMIEFMRPTHRSAHFRATDSKESPGRVGEE